LKLRFLRGWNELYDSDAGWTGNECILSLIVVPNRE
jgi:hypothetical protein